MRGAALREHGRPGKRRRRIRRPYESWISTRTCANETLNGVDGRRRSRCLPELPKEGFFVERFDKRRAFRRPHHESGQDNRAKRHRRRHQTRMAGTRARRCDAMSRLAVGARQSPTLRNTEPCARVADANAQMPIPPITQERSKQSKRGITGCAYKARHGAPWHTTVQHAGERAHVVIGATPTAPAKPVANRSAEHSM